MKRLTRLGIKYGTDKATQHLFTDIYDGLFEKYKNPSILELGVFHGASLLMYDEYFNGECTIVGLENGLDAKGDLKYVGNGKNITVITGDQSNIEDLKKCVETIKEYDIIIDDGGHFMKEQQVSLSFLFDYVKSGGIYILEDLHTSFRGYYNPKKDVTTLDVLNQLQKGSYTSPSRYISKADFDRLKKQIKSIEIFWKTPGDMSIKNSITSVITKMS